MDARASPPSSPVTPATTTAAGGQIRLVYGLTMLRDAVAYIAFAILWLFGYARVCLSCLPPSKSSPSVACLFPSLCPSPCLP